jgi:TRAP-type mannitol/chloroaromatic compound transport system permease large subunit
MKGVAPKDITMEEIIWASIPYIIFDIIVMAIIIVWPSIALWLPGLLKAY